MTKKQERALSLVFGVVFLVVILVLAVAVPNPEPFQYLVFRIVLALAAAGVAVTFSGFLEVTFAGWLKASGALGIFAVVFFSNPASLIATPEPAERTYRLEQVTQNNVLFPGGYKEFTVKVLDKHGQPVSGAKVLWQTPSGGDKAYISATDANGVTSATNLYAPANLGDYVQTATVVSSTTALGFTTAGAVPAAGPVASMLFKVQAMPPLGGTVAKPRPG